MDDKIQFLSLCNTKVNTKLNTTYWQVVESYVDRMLMKNVGVSSSSSTTYPHLNLNLSQPSSLLSSAE